MSRPQTAVPGPRSRWSLGVTLVTGLACGCGASQGNPGLGGDGGVGTDGGGQNAKCRAPREADVTGTERFEDERGGVATVQIGDRDSCARTYRSAPIGRCVTDRPANPRLVSEVVGSPILRSGNDMFDGLYAMANEEVRELSVDAVRDGSFNNGQSVGCGDGGCFETGRLWNYVWTRDAAYAVDLGLAAADSQRSLNTLLFKLSERRGGGDAQIVQDTGSGGSYPVSSDRVAWALGGLRCSHSCRPASEPVSPRAHSKPSAIPWSTIEGWCGTPKMVCTAESSRFSIGANRVIPIGPPPMSLPLR